MPVFSEVDIHVWFETSPSSFSNITPGESIKQSFRKIYSQMGRSNNTYITVANIIDNGAKNIVENNITTKEQYGVTATTNSDGTITLTGRNTDNTNFVLIYDMFNNEASSSFTSFIPSKKDGVYICPATGNPDVRVQVMDYNTASDYRVLAFSDDDVTFTFTKNYMVFRLWINSGADFTEPFTVKPMVCLNEAYQISNKFVAYCPTLSQLYNEVRGRKILLPTGDSTDRSAEILNALNNYGECTLSKGVFYVSGFEMPSGTTLNGLGKNTVVKLLNSVADGRCVQIRQNNTVKNICFSGGDTAPTNINTDGATVGTRHGIYLHANADGSGTTEDAAKINSIIDCWFENFSGAGYFAQNTGSGKVSGVIMSNCFITSCMVGIDIDYLSEYSHFTDISIDACNVACINNGGNNVFTNCTFHGVKGFVIDNTGNTKTNNAHGCCIGCEFNHIDNANYPQALGGGKSVEIKNITTGFIFDACQFWYSSVDIASSKGVIFSNCMFGGNTPAIKVKGAYVTWFKDCIFHATPSLDLNSITRFENCYVDSTGDMVQPDQMIVRSVDEGAKNIIDLTSMSTTTINGVTFTINANKTITMTGQASANTFFSVPITIPNGAYMFTGMTESGGTSTYRLELRSPTNVGTVYVTVESANGTKVLVDKTEGYFSGYFNIRVANGYNFGTTTGKTVSPMICGLDEWSISHKYVPYCPTLKTLYSMMTT